MQDLGYLTREADSQDQRSKRVKLTARGHGGLRRPALVTPETAVGEGLPHGLFDLASRWHLVRNCAQLPFRIARRRPGSETHLGLVRYWQHRPHAVEGTTL